MRYALALALLIAASGCAGEAQLAPVAAVPAASFDAPALEAPEPLPIARCSDAGRSCWTLARPCACPPTPLLTVASLAFDATRAIDTKGESAGALSARGPIAYVDFEPEPRIEYLDLEANP